MTSPPPGGKTAMAADGSDAPGRVAPGARAGSGPAESDVDLADLVARAVLAGEPRYTPAEVWARAGVDEATTRALWVAMGFAHVPDDARAFTELDVEALRLAEQLRRGAGGLDDARVLQQARVAGQAMSAVAASHIDVLAARTPDTPRPAAPDLEAFAAETLPALDRLLPYLYRRHLLAAVERVLLGPAASGGPAADDVAVGFADLVGFTALSNRLSGRELASLVEAFAEATGRVVAEEGGRVVKMVGDEVMFSADDPGQGAVIAHRLVTEVGDHDDRPPMRAGLAAGPVVPRHGDLFGSPVNLASRLVDLARPGRVVVDDRLAAALAHDPSWHTRVVPSIRSVRGFGRVRVHSLRRAEAAERPRRRGA